MKVFWTWQSDTPGPIGRFLIRDALKTAIKQLQQEPDVTEPTERENRDALHLDHDRQGVLGSPDLAATIMAKIDEAAVVVADITPVGSAFPPMDGQEKSKPTKLLMNPNVAVEVGYALDSQTVSVVLGNPWTARCSVNTRSSYWHGR